MACGRGICVEILAKSVWTYYEVPYTNWRGCDTSLTKVCVHMLVGVVSWESSLVCSILSVY